MANPIIQSLSDDSVYMGEYLKISGKGFVSQNTNVYFNGSIYEDVIIVSNNTITLHPNSKGKYKVTVAVFENSSNSKYLTVYGPEFSGLSKTEVFPLDTVILYGKYLSNKNTSKVRLLDDEYYTEFSIIYVSANQIKFIVPYPDAGGYYLRYERNDSWSVPTGFIIRYKLPEITSISKSNLRAGDTVIVKGKNFLKYKNYSVASSSWSEYQVLSVKDDEVIFYVRQASGGHQNVYLSFDGLKISLGEFQHDTPLAEYSSNYFYGLDNSSGHVYYQNKYFYFYRMENTTNYSINALNNSNYSQSITTVKLNTYTPQIIKMIEDNWLYYFVRMSSNVKDTLYLCKIDMNTNTFTSNTIVIPKKLLANFIAFRLNGYSYLGPDVENNFWRIDDNNVVERVMSLPFHSFSQISYFVYNNILYLISGQEMFLYRANTNQWSYVGKTPTAFAAGSLTAILDGKAYVLSNDRIWRFDPATNLWQRGTIIISSNSYNLITSEKDKLIFQIVSWWYGTHITHYYPDKDLFVNVTK